MRRSDSVSVTSRHPGPSVHAGVPARRGVRPGSAAQPPRMLGHVRNRGLRRSPSRRSRSSSDGLRRLEYRGYDSAGVAVIDRRRSSAPRKRAGKLATWRRRSPTTAARPTADDRHRPHPLGHPRRPDRRATPTRTSATTASSRVIHNGIIENFAELKAELVADGRRRSAARPTPRSPPTCSAARVPRRPATCAEAMRAVVPPPRRRVHAARRARGRSPASSSAPAATRRWWSASATARTSSARTSPRSSSTPARRSSSARTRSSTITPDARRRSPTSTGSPVEAETFHVDWDASAAEKGGYDVLHAKEIAEQPRGGRRHAARPARRRRPADPRRGRASPTRCCATIDKIFIVACGTAAYAGHGRASTRSSTGPGSRARSSWPTSSATATRSSDRRTLVVAISQSGETMDTLMAVRARPRAEAPRCWRSATPTARRSRASPTPCSTRTPAPRSRSPRPRRSSPSSPRCYLVGLHLGPGARHQVRRRGRAQCCASCRRCPAKIADGAGRRWSRSASWPRLDGRHPLGAVPRPPRRLPGGAGGRAQAQGARLHPRRGLRGRRAQARPDRADRARASRSSCVVPSPARPRVLHDKVVSNIQEIRARGARTIVIAEEGDDAVLPYADDLIRVPLTPTAARSRWSTDRAAAGLRLRAGDRQGPRRRPAAQPGQVGHGRVAPAAATGGRSVIVGSASTSSTSRGSTRRRAHARLLADAPVHRRSERASAGRRSLAARFAAKEALAKALGAPAGLRWHDARSSREARRPALRSCRGTVAARAETCGVTRWHVSLSPTAGSRRQWWRRPA